MALVEIDEEDDVVTEAGHAVHGWHSDDEREEVVDEGVDGAVDESSPGQERNLRTAEGKQNGKERNLGNG